MATVFDSATIFEHFYNKLIKRTQLLGPYAAPITW